MVKQSRGEGQQGSNQDPSVPMEELAAAGIRLNPESREYFGLGYREVAAGFDPNVDTFTNIVAALAERSRRLDLYAANQGGYVLGGLAAIHDLQGDQR